MPPVTLFPLEEEEVYDPLTCVASPQVKMEGTQVWHVHITVLEDFDFKVC